MSRRRVRSIRKAAPLLHRSEPPHWVTYGHTGNRHSPCDDLARSKLTRLAG